MIQKENGMRGIIADSVEFKGDKAISIRSGIDPFRLRQYLLYWDRIDYPTNNLIRIGLTPDEEYLQNIGILKRTKMDIQFQGHIPINPEFFINNQLYALEENNKNPGEIWSIAQNNSQLVLPPEKSIQAERLQVELYDCVPVPSIDTAFDDILDFKEKRRDELLEFRRVMDNMYDSILTSEFPELQKKRSIEELQNKIIEINRVMSESRIKRCLSNLSVELNVNELVKAFGKGIGGYMVGETIGFPELGAAYGLATSAVNVTYNVAMKAKSLPEGLKDYAYLFHAKKEIL